MPAIYAKWKAAFRNKHVVVTLVMAHCEVNFFLAGNEMKRKVFTRDVEAVIFQTLPLPLPHLSLPLPLTKREKTTVDNFF